MTLMGIGIVLMSADVIEVDEAAFHAPRWTVGIVGAIF